MNDPRIPKLLAPLIEDLAKNVHDTWMNGRLNEGWTFGKIRDDFKKNHPCLIPYKDLPESEKEYDRQTAIKTLEFILDNGYEIIERKDKQRRV